MKIFFSFAFHAFFTLSTFVAMGQAELIVMVTQIPSLEGTIKLAVFDQDETFLSDQYFRTAELPVKGTNEIRITLKEIPFGTYAISVFHDKNGNGRLDKKIFGIPTEAYGFSNNARKKFGPPQFKDAMFDLNSAKEFLQIDLQ